MEVAKVASILDGIFGGKEKDLKALQDEAEALKTRATDLDARASVLEDIKKSKVSIVKSKARIKQASPSILSNKTLLYVGGALLILIVFLIMK